MWRAANFAVAGVALFAGVILAWAGGVGGQRDVSETQHVDQMRARLDAVAREVLVLRQDVDNLKKKAPAPVASDEETITKKEETQGRGRITKIDPTDATLVEVDLGKDAGLEKHNTLEIFRPGTQRDYVGTLRIFDVYKESAFCRLVSTNPVRKYVVKVGDQVQAPSKVAVR